MHFTKKTYYALGIVAAGCNVLGSALLLAGVAAGLLFHLGALTAAGMMLFLASRQPEKLYRVTALLGALLTIFGWLPGAVGLVCAALGWPVFAVPYYTAQPPEAVCRKAAGLVFFTGAVQLAGSFVAMPDTVRICLAMFIALTQGVLAWVLFGQEAAAQPKE